jgi:methionyl-tRNA synthetase
MSETNYMFRLSALRDRLLQWLESNQDVIVPHQYHNEVRGSLLVGLHDISVSRQNVSWGISVPGDPSQTMYVWIDALANYLTVSGWGTDNWIWPCDAHVIGKDILKFHGIIWPGILIAAGIQPFKRLIVHGWWTLSERKMSKSLGNTLDPKALREFWGVDTIKFLMLRHATLTCDSEYAIDVMLAVYTSELDNNLSNLVMRVLSPGLMKEMKVPSPGQYGREDLELIEVVEALPGIVDHHLAVGQTRIAIEAIFDVLRKLNRYLSTQMPWRNVPTAPTVKYVLLDSLRLCMLCLWPFMSQTAARILAAVGAHVKPEFQFGVLTPGTPISELPRLFPRKAAT